MNGGGIDIIAALKRMEEMGIVRPMTEEELRPIIEKDLEAMRKKLDELMINEIEKLLKNDNLKKTFRPR